MNMNTAPDESKLHEALEALGLSDRELLNAIKALRDVDVEIDKELDDIKDRLRALERGR